MDIQQLLQRAERLVGRPAVSWRKTTGGYTPAERWVITFDDGSSVFAKLATTDLTATWLRNEHAFYSAVGEQPWLPRLLGFDDGPLPLLLLEDLSAAHWPPPWTLEYVRSVISTLETIGSVRPPLPLPALTAMPDHQPSFAEGWSAVAAEPGPFLALGLCSAQWLESALPALLASQSVSLEGESLLHNDLRSDNLCFLGERTILIDWNGAAVGNPLFDIAFWLPSLQFEGGPQPEAAYPAAAPFAGIVSGFFAARAGLPDILDAPFVRRVQREQLSTALPWAARVFGLPPLDGPAKAP